jgi:transposase
MNVATHHSEQQLQRLADQESRADLAKRLRTVFLAKQGFTAPEISLCTGFSPRSVQEWVGRYNREGLSGLETKPGRGRKPPLTPDEAERLKRRIDAGPLPDDGVCTLRGKDVQRILQREFGRLRSLNAVYGLLHRLGYSSLVPRPQHPEADPAAQEEFKKSSANGSRRFRPRIPAAVCKYSTKTKPALVSKER